MKRSLASYKNLNVHFHILYDKPFTEKGANGGRISMLNVLKHFRYLVVI